MSERERGERECVCVWVLDKEKVDREIKEGYEKREIKKEGKGRS